MGCCQYRARQLGNCQQTRNKYIFMQTSDFNVKDSYQIETVMFNFPLSHIWQCFCFTSLQARSADLLARPAGLLGRFAPSLKWRQNAVITHWIFMKFEYKYIKGIFNFMWHAEFHFNGTYKRAEIKKKESWRTTDITLLWPWSLSQGHQIQ